MPFSKRFILFFFIGLPFWVSAFQLKSVTIQLNYNAQPDTVGFNLVEALPDFFYTQLIAGNLFLYDSPAKKVKISADALSAIETANHSKASQLKTLFIHEYWTLERKELTCYSMGVSLNDYDTKGNVISYGYVDLKEAFDLLNSHYIKSNVNGQARLTYWQAISSRRFNYSIIQFGKKVLHDRDEADRIKLNVLAKATKTWESTELEDIKTITYQIVLPSTENEGNEKNKVLINKLQNLVISSAQLRDSCKAGYNTDTKNLTLSKIEIEEVWARKDGFFEYEPISFTLYAANNPYCTLKFADFSSVDFKLFENDITSKQFVLIITAINQQSIKPAEASDYLYALRSGETPWTQLSTFIKKRH